jgi:SAM-dependent methyltransferase
MADWSAGNAAGGVAVAANPYLFGDAETDRIRLETQAMLFSSYLRTKAPQFIGPKVRRILDIGCGAGQLTTTLARVYPNAEVIGVDNDPRAIAKARARAVESKRGNVEFQVGDITAGLPAGPFDLIYASLVLLHIREYEQVVREAYGALAPGGMLWVKDLHPAIETALPHPTYQRAMGLTYATLEAIGAHPYLGRELPGHLEQFGFEAIRVEVETYPLGGTTPSGQAALGILLGAIYNARQLVSRIQGVPENEIVKMYVEIGEFARGNAMPVGLLQLSNVLARRPAA